MAYAVVKVWSEDRAFDEVCKVFIGKNAKEKAEDFILDNENKSEYHDLKIVEVEVEQE